MRPPAGRLRAGEGGQFAGRALDFPVYVLGAQHLVPHEALAATIEISDQEVDAAEFAEKRKVRGPGMRSADDACQAGS